MRKTRASAPAGMRPSALILIGFMGAGKSSVGHALADRLGWIFEDLDDRIERRERKTVPEIFRDFGEPAFRAAEHAALKELLSEFPGWRKKIVALGGGAFVQGNNRRLIEAAGIPTVFLDTDVDELWRRCREQAHDSAGERPLLHDPGSFRALYDVRRPDYLRASQRQETAGKTTEQVAAEIVKLCRLDGTGRKEIRGTTLSRKKKAGK